MEVFSQDYNLLLSYTYFLNKSHTLKISVGFDCETFEASCIFHRIGKRKIVLKYHEWNKFYYQFNAKLNMQMIKDIKESLHHGLRSVNGQSISINKEEAELFYNLNDFIEAVMTQYKSAELNVKEYVVEYLKLCDEQKVLRLQKEIYIPIQRFNVQCNYSRLFFEIPVMLKQKICNNLHK